MQSYTINGQGNDRIRKKRKTTVETVVFI